MGCGRVLSWGHRDQEKKIRMTFDLYEGSLLREREKKEGQIGRLSKEKSELLFKCLKISIF